MESNQQVLARPGSQIRQINGSNVFSKNSQSRLYETIDLQPSTVHHNQVYDSQYRTGFPKLYSFDTSAQNKSRMSLDARGKYSFRNDYSKIVEQNTLLIRQSTFLREEITRLTTIIQVERRNGGNRTEIDRLNALLIQRDTEIRTLKERIFFLESQGSKTNQWQIRFNESQTTIVQLNSKVTSLTQQLSQYESQFNQLNSRLTQYQTEISQLNVQIREYTTRISQLERQQKPAPPVRTDPQVEQLRNEIYSLTSKIQQYQLQISQYERTFTQYESQISTLQQTNWKLEERVSREQSVVQPQPKIIVENEEWIFEQGKLNFRIIILLEEINRLKQRQQELVVKAEELHAYLLKAENYIEEIQLELEKNNLKENVPTYIVEKVTHLEQQNTRYSLLIEELQSRLSVTQVNGVSEDEHYAKLGERDFRVIILMEEINRLNQKIIETRKYLESAQNYIEQIQSTIQQRQTIIPPEVEAQLTYLSQENHRLNTLIQNYIDEIKHLSINVPVSTHTKVQYQIPTEVQNRLAFLTQQNERLNAFVIELERKLEVPSAPKIQYQIPTEVQNRLAFLTQQNERLNAFVIELERKLEVPSAPKIQYQIPTEVQNRLAFMTQQNERLIAVISEYERRSVQITSVPVYENQTSPEIQNKIAFLSQQNERLSNLVIELQNRPAVIPLPTSVDPQLEADYAKVKFRVIILLEEINRLNNAFKEVSSYLVNAENYIQQLEIRLHQQSSNVVQNVQYIVPEQLEQEIAGMTLKKIILLEEINRLNHAVKQSHSQLINAENFIEQLEMRLHEKSSTVIQTNVQNIVTEQTQREIAGMTLQKIILLEEINRLNYVVKEIHSHLINAENYIEQCEIRINEFSQISNRTVEFQVPPEIQARLALLAQENERLTLIINDLQTRPARVETRIEQKVEFRIPPEIEKRINLLASENQRLERLLSQGSNQQGDEMTFETAKLRFRIIILLEEINRLNFVSEQLRQNLINAENYIFEFENRPPQVVVPAQLENEIFSLRTENQNLHAQLNKISLEYEQRISIYKTEISNINIQLSTFRSEATTYKSRFQELERKSVISSGSSQVESQLQAKLATEQFRTLILLQEINRLNHKLSAIDAERVEVIGHLVNAQNYIQDLEVKVGQLEGGSKQQTITNNTMVQGSNSAIIELNAQLVELQNRGRVEIAQKDLRIIFLLEQINRLNHKVQQLTGSQDSGSSSEMFALQKAKQQTERQLQQVLSHLRQAEEYIGQILRDNEGLTMERDHLINELNRLTGTR